MCDVLTVLGDDVDQLQATLDLAVDLANRENARLTLAKTCGYPPLILWICPLGGGSAYVPPAHTEDACELLTRAVDSVPSWLPVTTKLLDHPTQRSLIKLVLERQYDAVVAEERLLSRSRRLRRVLQQQAILEVPVTAALRPPVLVT